MNSGWFNFVSMSPSMIGGGVLLTGALSAFIWWLVRKREVQVKLPTIRILDLEREVLPRLQLAPPPWVPFACFVLLALVLGFFAHRPKEFLYLNSDPTRTKIHILVDLTASVSAAASLEMVAAKSAELFGKLEQQSSMSLSFSDGTEIFKPNSADAVQQAILAKGWQIAGARIGDAVADILNKERGLDRLLVVSDRDESSWGGFTWKALSREVRVERIDLTEKSKAVNVFVNQIEKISQTDSKSLIYDVEIIRSGNTPGGGKILGELGGKILWEGAWNFVGERSRVILRLSAPVSTIERTLKDNKTKAEPKEMGTNDHLPQALSQLQVTWKLVPDGLDSISLDNIFHSILLFQREKTVVVAESEGERMLDDSVGPLMVGLDILGMNPARRERPEAGGKHEPGLRIILPPLAGKSTDLGFCPAAGPAAQVAVATKAGGQAWLWLAPRVVDDDFGRLCRCLAKLRGDSADYCSKMSSRNSWSGLLASLGGKQVGGSLGATQEAIAFALSPGADGTRILAFSVPLGPLPAMGITHGKFPLLLRELLVFSGRLSMTNAGRAAAESWPRIQNIWEYVKNTQVNTVLGSLGLANTNVPVGESLNSEVAMEELPPLADAGSPTFAQAVSPRQERETADRWVQGMFLFALGILALELLHGAKSVRKERRRRAVSLASGVWFGFLVSVVASTPARAKVDLVQSGYPSGTMAFGNLAKETQGRTSLQLNSLPLSATISNSELSRQGWLWSNGIEPLVDATGALRNEVVQWIRRGGFLVVERSKSREVLEKLVGPMFLQGKSATHWEPIPPDHEIMRSFYLLDSLPQCQEGSASGLWYGLQFDGRLAMLATPYSLLSVLQDRPPAGPCSGAAEVERNVRAFVNIVLVSLTMDYKKDQIHLPEILKRLR